MLLEIDDCIESYNISLTLSQGTDVTDNEQRANHRTKLTGWGPDAFSLKDFTHGTANRFIEVKLAYTVHNENDFANTPGSPRSLT